MNREIKFRAWDKENKRWDNLPLLEVTTGLLFEDGRSVEDNRIYRPDAFILMQFTGLKDKNGKEIYEEDIVKWSSWRIGTWKQHFEENYHYQNKIVIWSNKRGSWILGNDEHWNLGIYDNVEVIGNIYENPELLKP